jgi:hypothetical protein
VTLPAEQLLDAKMLSKVGVSYCRFAFEASYGVTF